MPETLIMEFHSNGMDAAELYKRLYDRLDVHFAEKQNVPGGLLVHIPTLINSGTTLVVTEVWETKRQQETFAKEKLVPSLAAIDAPLPIRNDWGQPVEIFVNPEVTTKRYPR